jgi:PTH1 family peptidyl-tRNA hydrolase
MKAIIGLGNPGMQYAHNRHNVGFMVLDRLAARWKVKDWFTRYQARLGNVSFPGERVVLAKPQTFMNNSGSAVKAILTAYSIPPEDLLLVYDDLDLEVGQLRVRRRGSAGGHKGFSSLTFGDRQPASG